MIINAYLSWQIGLDNNIININQIKFILNEKLHIIDYN